MPQPTRRGVGVAIVFRKRVRCLRVPIPASSTFEAIFVRFITTSGPAVVLNVYRPAAALFFQELSAVLETLVVFACPVIIGGDFNIAVQNVNDLNTRRFNELLTSFDLVQHVSGKTHRDGGTLDLVLTSSEQPFDTQIVEPAGAVSRPCTHRVPPVNSRRAAASRRAVSAGMATRRS